MRIRMTARKSTGGPVNPAQINRLKEMTEKNLRKTVRLYSSNTVGQVSNVVTLTPSNQLLTSANKNEVTNIRLAVGQNDPMTIKKLPVKVIPLVSPEISKKSSTPKPTKLSALSQSFTDKTAMKLYHSICNQQETTNSMQSDEPISKDEIPLANRIHRQRKQVQKGSISKRSSKSVRHRIVLKQEKKAEDKIYKELITQCDKEVLFDMLLKEFDSEKILKKYKEKNNWDRTKIQNESSIININENSQNNCTSSKLTSVQKVLVEVVQKVLELLKFVGSTDDVIDMVLKTCHFRLNAPKVSELLEPEEKKKLIDLFCQGENSSTIQQVLEIASVDTIINKVRERNDLKTSETLLSLLLENFSEMSCEKISQTLGNPKFIKSVLEFASVDIIIDFIKSKKYLQDTECAMCLMSENDTKSLNDKNKQKFVKVLIDKFSSDELVDVLKLKLIQEKEITKEMIRIIH